MITDETIAVQVGPTEWDGHLSPVPFPSPALVLAASPLPGAANVHESDALALRSELEAARAVQQSLLPKSFPHLEGYQLAGFCRSARHVSGDFYDVVPLQSGSVLLVVADVMGKGVPAALFAATLRTLVRTMAQWTERPADMLARINALMCEELSNVDMFITAQLAVVDARQGLLRVASAGHHPLLLADGRGEVNAVSTEGLPLGISPNCVFEEKCVTLGASAHALLYTDGLTEARNIQGCSFGEPGLKRWLRQSATGDSSAAELKEHFLLELTRFQGSGPINDDQTFLLLAPLVSSAQTFPEFAASLPAA